MQYCIEVANISFCGRGKITQSKACHNVSENLKDKFSINSIFFCKYVLNHSTTHKLSFAQTETKVMVIDLKIKDDGQGRS